MAICSSAVRSAVEDSSFDDKDRSFDADENEKLRCLLREGGDSVSAALLQQELRRAHKAVKAEHCAVTTLWRAPLSLFDDRSRDEATQRGVPSWAVSGVLRVQQLVEDAAALGDLTEAYEVQIAAARREGRRMKSEPLLKLLEALDGLAKQLRAELRCLKAARAAFDCPAEAPAECSPASSSRLSAVAALSEELRDVEVPILEPEPAAYQRLWRWGTATVVAVGREAKHRAAPSAKMKESVSAHLGVAGRNSRDMVRGALETATRISEGVRLAVVSELGPLVGRGANETVLERAAWHDVSGEMSSWLDVVEVARARRHLDARLRLHDLDSLHCVQNPAQSRWERCRRGSERRWTLS